ncbi:MAG: hypothetical protein M1606_00935 [Candidatus Thermoplasmatota archaeon]|nr:hypothetical protein [Candidatus Thermoplasmatota archaeon]
MEASHPLMEQAMESCAANSDERKSFEEWKKAYTSDTRRCQLRDWEFLPFKQSRGVGSKTVRIVIPAPLEKDLTERRDRVWVARVVSVRRGREVPDERFPSTYKVSVFPWPGQEGIIFGVNILPIAYHR